MEARLHNGDYIPDGLGGVVRCKDGDALLERVLFRLTARRGGFPLLPQLGSRLYLLGREPAAQRLSAARLFAAEALADEDVTVSGVSLTPVGGGRIYVRVMLDYQGTELAASVTV